MASALYVHIPFCLKRCSYCDFVSDIHSPEKEDLYLRALRKEIMTIENKYPLQTLYIGGGTPTVLSSDALADMLAHIFKHFNFTEDIEASIEANPGTLDEGKIRLIRSSGINRLSIGVQSFDDEELSFLGRIHAQEDAVQAFLLARDAGFQNIGIDLMYGIPGQRIETWGKTLEMAVSLNPEHISTYELMIEEGTPLYECLKNPPLSPFCKRGNIFPLWQSRSDTSQRLASRGERGDFINFLRLPDEDQIIEMYNHAIDYLRSEGYIHYEISNFARPDCFCRHNLNYWNRGEYHGAGLGAHSFVNGMRAHNTCDLDEYISSLSEDGALMPQSRTEENESRRSFIRQVEGSARGVKEIFSGNKNIKKVDYINNDNYLSELLFLGLRKTEGINVKVLSERYSKNISAVYQEELKEALETGLIEFDETKTWLKLTRKGLLLSNEVFARFV